MNLSEIRSHPDQNPKLKTIDVIKQNEKIYGDKLFVHFSRIDKLGINPNYGWEFTPAGLYARSVEEALHDLQSNYFYDQYKFATLLTFSSSAKILNLSSTNQNTLNNLMRLAYDFYKKKTNITDKNAKPFLDMNVRETWHKIAGIFMDLWDKDQRSPFYWNAIVRKLGYNVLMDNDGIIHEDHTTQVVFLTPDSYKVITQEIIRRK